MLCILTILFILFILHPDAWKLIFNNYDMTVSVIFSHNGYSLYPFMCQFKEPFLKCGCESIL
uniref:Uncharacterized protein n=1 Tax=Rhizophora mucronata TaxID=61149 RepID=A0A2P2NK30_RHIMU